MLDITNFKRKHVFNFRPLNVVLFIRMSIYECIRGKKEAWKLFFKQSTIFSLSESLNG